ALNDAAQLNIGIAAAAQQFQRHLLTAIADGKVDLTEAAAADAALQDEPVQRSLPRAVGEFHTSIPPAAQAATLPAPPIAYPAAPARGRNPRRRRSTWVAAGHAPDSAGHRSSAAPGSVLRGHPCAGTTPADVSGPALSHASAVPVPIAACRPSG